MISGEPMSDEATERITEPALVPERSGSIREVDAEAAPVGTLFFMILLLLLMVGLWVTVYWMLLSR